MLELDKMEMGIDDSESVLPDLQGLRSQPAKRQKKDDSAVNPDRT